MFQIGQKFGQYTLVGKLARGGFGEVWLAEKQSPLITRRVAVKLPRDGEFNFEEVRRETELWEQANGHPNVVPLIDADVHDGQVFIVSEYIEGGSLADRLRKDGKLPVAETVRIVIGVLNGLEYLHSKKIIHRDIKPANILMQDGTPRLADFGLSRAVEVSSLVSSTIIGTQPYMSPEAFEGVRSVQTDVWSVGVLLYHLLTGEVPFPLGQPSEIMYAVMLKEPAPLPYEMPASLQKIIYKALEKDRELNGKSPRRYQTAAEMRADLESFLEEFVSLQAQRQQQQVPSAFETIKVPPQQMPSVEMATRMRVPVKNKRFWHELARRKFTPVAFLAVILGVGAMVMLVSFLFSGKSSSNGGGDLTVANSSVESSNSDSNSAANQSVDDSAVRASKELYRRAEEFYTRKKYEKAIETYTQAIELNPNDYALFNNRGAAFYATGEFQKAIADYTKALELNPYHFSAYNNRGVAYQEIGSVEQAIADYRKALELDPENKLAKNNLKRILK